MVKGHNEFDKDLFLSKQPKQASYVRKYNYTNIKKKKE